MTITIYHNPACGTSRKALAMIRASGEEPEVIEYLETPPGRDKLVDLIAGTGLSVRDVLREKGTPYQELGLDDPRWTDDQLIDLMVEHPILMNRPIVVTPLGTVLARPSQKVLDVLPKAGTKGSFGKENGAMVPHEAGDRKMTNRFDTLFARLRDEGRPALVTYVMGGDPDHDTSLDIICALPEAGADIIELGMAFSDPMADGPAIQMAGQRALKGGQTLAGTLAMATAFRARNSDTPIVLMGYYNPIYVYGVDRFLADARQAGIDGLIVVDLPPEMDDELCIPALDAGISFIRLATPTTDDKRLPAVLENTSGFVYYVSMTGITGQAIADTAAVGEAVTRIKAHTPLPVCVGFGVKTAEQAGLIGRDADGVVVGTAIVQAIALSLDEQGRATADTVAAVKTLVQGLAAGVRASRLEAAE